MRLQKRCLLPTGAAATWEEIKAVLGLCFRKTCNECTLQRYPVVQAAV